MFNFNINFTSNHVYNIKFEPIYRCIHTNILDMQVHVLNFDL